MTGDKVGNASRCVGLYGAAWCRCRAFCPRYKKKATPLFTKSLGAIEQQIAPAEPRDFVDNDTPCHLGALLYGYFITGRGGGVGTELGMSAGWLPPTGSEVIW